jgi:tight adherence protein C
MLDLVTAAIFLFVVSLVWLLGRVVLRPRQRTVITPSLENVSLGPSAELYDAPRSAWTESLAGQLTLFAGDELDKDLRRAGHYWPRARQRFLARRNGLMILAVIVTGILVVWIGPQHRRAVWWTLGVGSLAAILGFTLPRIALTIGASRRVGRIRAALPDALDTVSMCLHGGISLQECLGYVGQEMMSVHPDLALELLMVGQHTDINSFEFAFQQFAARIDAPEVVALAALVTQTQRLGTGIVDSIRDFADNLRLKRRQMAEARASRTELFLLFPIIFCLMPSILLILWGPPILTLIDFIRGPASPLRMNP